MDDDLDRLFNLDSLSESILDSEDEDLFANTQKRPRESDGHTQGPPSKRMKTKKTKKTAQTATVTELPSNKMRALFNCETAPVVSDLEDLPTENSPPVQSPAPATNRLLRPSSFLGTQFSNAPVVDNQDDTAAYVGGLDMEDLMEMETADPQNIEDVYQGSPLSQDPVVWHSVILGGADQSVQLPLVSYRHRISPFSVNQDYLPQTSTIRAVATYAQDPNDSASIGAHQNILHQRHHHHKDMDQMSTHDLRLHCLVSVRAGAKESTSVPIQCCGEQSTPLRSLPRWIQKAPWSLVTPYSTDSTPPRPETPLPSMCRSEAGRSDTSSYVSDAEPLSDIYGPNGLSWLSYKKSDFDRPVKLSLHQQRRRFSELVIRQTAIPPSFASSRGQAGELPGGKVDFGSGTPPYMVLIGPEAAECASPLFNYEVRLYRLDSRVYVFAHNPRIPVYVIQRVVSYEPLLQGSLNAYCIGGTPPKKLSSADEDRGVSLFPSTKAEIEAGGRGFNTHEDNTRLDADKTKDKKEVLGSSLSAQFQSLKKVLMVQGPKVPMASQLEKWRHLPIPHQNETKPVSEAQLSLLPFHLRFRLVKKILTDTVYTSMQAAEEIAQAVLVSPEDDYVPKNSPFQPFSRERLLLDLCGAPQQSLVHRRHAALVLQGRLLDLEISTLSEFMERCGSLSRMLFPEKLPLVDSHGRRHPIFAVLGEMESACVQKRDGDPALPAHAAILRGLDIDVSAEDASALPANNHEVQKAKARRMAMEEAKKKKEKNNGRNGEHRGSQRTSPDNVDLSPPGGRQGTGEEDGEEDQERRFQNMENNLEPTWVVHHVMPKFLGRDRKKEREDNQDGPTLLQSRIARVGGVHCTYTSSHRMNARVKHTLSVFSPHGWRQDALGRSLRSNEDMGREAESRDFDLHVVRHSRCLHHLRGYLRLGIRESPQRVLQAVDSFMRCHMAQHYMKPTEETLLHRGLPSNLFWATLPLNMVGAPMTALVETGASLSRLRRTLYPDMLSLPSYSTPAVALWAAAATLFPIHRPPRALDLHLSSIVNMGLVDFAGLPALWGHLKSLHDNEEEGEDEDGNLVFQDSTFPANEHFLLQMGRLCLVECKLNPVVSPPLARALVVHSVCGFGTKLGLLSCKVAERSADFQHRTKVLLFRIAESMDKLFSIMQEEETCIVSALAKLGRVIAHPGSSLAIAGGSIARKLHLCSGLEASPSSEPSRLYLLSSSISLPDPEDRERVSLDTATQACLSCCQSLSLSYIGLLDAWKNAISTVVSQWRAFYSHQQLSVENVKEILPPLESTPMFFSSLDTKGKTYRSFVKMTIVNDRELRPDRSIRNRVILVTPHTIRSLIDTPPSRLARRGKHTGIMFITDIHTIPCASLTSFFSLIGSMGLFPCLRTIYLVYNPFIPALNHVQHSPGAILAWYSTISSSVIEKNVVQRHLSNIDYMDEVEKQEIAEARQNYWDNDIANKSLHWIAKLTEAFSVSVQNEEFSTPLVFFDLNHFECGFNVSVSDTTEALSCLYSAKNLASQIEERQRSASVVWAARRDPGPEEMAKLVLGTVSSDSGKSKDGASRPISLLSVYPLCISREKRTAYAQSLKRNVVRHNTFLSFCNASSMDQQVVEQGETDFDNVASTLASMKHRPTHIIFYLTSQNRHALETTSLLSLFSFVLESTDSSLIVGTRKSSFYALISKDEHRKKHGRARALLDPLVARAHQSFLGVT